MKKQTDEESADMLIINGCSVRKAATDRAYSKIKQNTGKKLILAWVFSRCR